MARAARPSAYAAAGVSIDVKERALRRIKQLARSTFTPGVLSEIGLFGGLYRPDLRGRREPVPLLNRHRVGADLMLEKPEVYRVGIEGIYYGRQVLDDNPYRSRSKPHVYAMAIAMRQFGPVEVVANFENLLDVRQTRYQSLVRPAPAVGGRWTTDVWAPLEGFMANVAVRFRWPQSSPGNDNNGQ